mmetsp:Transcript_106598/g.340097  ORF Transcript_106598/g.340097 Transcript_106598/m.340097 type:complete len:218 (-) Transcript_106598:786-1439(-)
MKSCSTEFTWKASKPTTSKMLIHAFGLPRSPSRPAPTSQARSAELLLLLLIRDLVATLTLSTTHLKSAPYNVCAKPSERSLTCSTVRDVEATEPSGNVCSSVLKAAPNFDKSMPRRQAMSSSTLGSTQRNSAEPSAADHASSPQRRVADKTENTLSKLEGSPSTSCNAGKIALFHCAESSTSANSRQPLQHNIEYCNGLDLILKRFLCSRVAPLANW